MTTRLPIAVCLSALLLTACGNKADLLTPDEVPPEDARRFIIESSVPTQEERDAAAEAAEEARMAREDAEDAAFDREASDAESDDTGTDDADSDADDVQTDPVDPLPPVPVILDVPAPVTP